MIVEGPNGVRVEFPDGTPPETVDRVMREATGTTAPAAPPRTMAPAPYFRPEQPAPAPAMGQTPQLGPDSLSPGAFGNTRFNPLTASRAPDLVPSLRVAADMVRMGQPGGGAVYPGPGPSPPGGQLAPAQPPSNPNLNNSSVFQPQPLPVPQVAQAPVSNAPTGFGPQVADPSMMADPNAALTRSQPGALPETGFATGGPIEPMGAPPMPGLEAPKAEALAQVLVTVIPGLGWARGVSLAANLLRTFAGGAIAGGTTAGLQGGDLQDVGVGAGFGGLAGAAIPAVGVPLARGIGALAKGVGSVVNNLTGRARALPDTAGLHAASQAAYRAADQSGAIIAPNVVQSASNVLETVLQGANLDAAAHPASARALAQIQSRLDEATQRGGLRFEDISNLRTFVTDAMAGAEGPDRRVASILSREFNKFLDELTPQDIIGGGNIDEAVAAYRAGQATWGRYLRSAELDEMMRVAQATPAGYEQGLINEFRKLYRDPERWARYTPEEQDAIRQVISGGPISSVLRLFGKAAPTGIVSTGGGAGVGALIGTGMGNPLAGAVAVPALGAGAKFAADFATRRAADRVSQLVRGRTGSYSPQLQGIVDALLSGSGRLAATEQDQWRPPLVPGNSRDLGLIDALLGVPQRAVRTFSVAP